MNKIATCNVCIFMSSVTCWLYWFVCNLMNIGSLNLQHEKPKNDDETISFYNGLCISRLEDIRYLVQISNQT